MIVGGLDKPGRRHCVRVGDDGWEERYDDGTLTRFEPAGVLVKDGHTRQVLRCVPDATRGADFQVLIPPPVEGSFLEFRYGNGPWRQLSRVRFLEYGCPFAGQRARWFRRRRTGRYGLISYHFSPGAIPLPRRR